MADSNIIQIVKRAAVDAVKASKPCDYLIGKVTGINPLLIRISKDLELERDFLQITETASEKMQVGDNVLLVRKAGGKEYVVLDKVVNV